MDRIIVYPGSVPLDTDVLNTNRNAMLALSALISAALGRNTVVDGLVVGPGAAGGLTVQVGAGSITQYTVVDATAYGTLGTDTADTCVKMGINPQPTQVTLAAPTAAGTEIVYLVEAVFSETDIDPVVLNYYNPANPAQAWLGPSGDGQAQATLRTQRVAIQAIGGAPAAVGSASAPAATAGWTGLAAVSVPAGTTTITADLISALPWAPLIPYKLPLLRPGFASVQAFAASGAFTVPAGVTNAKITVIGGGGAGGLHQSLPSGGGGAGGQAVVFVNYLEPGTQIPVTVGGGGVPPSGTAYGQGGGGGTSSFGTIVSATGGQGGAGGTTLASCAGGPGGEGVGGNINFGGAYGTDGIMLTGRGGDGGGPGGGRGTSSNVQGIAGQGYGGGGGGGGSSSPGGGGTGAPGGAGAAGLVIVEY